MGGIGTINFDPPGGVYAPGTKVTITVTPNPHYGFIYIAWDDGSTSGELITEVTMDRDRKGFARLPHIGPPLVGP